MRQENQDGLKYRDPMSLFDGETPAEKNILLSDQESFYDGEDDLEILR